MLHYIFFKVTNRRLAYYSDSRLFQEIRISDWPQKSSDFLQARIGKLEEPLKHVLVGVLGLGTFSQTRFQLSTEMNSLLDSQLKQLFFLSPHALVIQQLMSHASFSFPLDILHDKNILFELLLIAHSYHYFDYVCQSFLRGCCLFTWVVVPHV